jgi:hypothetical protein
MHVMSELKYDKLKNHFDENNQCNYNVEATGEQQVLLKLIKAFA